MFLGGDPASDASWALQSFQAGEAPFYLEHLRRAVELTNSNPDTVLILSGGQTRAEAGPRSEARSYRELAGIMGWSAQTILEEYSRDSFENLLFSLCEFRQAVGAFPEHVTVAGWGFKRERYDLHRATIGWPAERFTYVGVNQPDDLPAALAGEQRTLSSFRQDPFGRSGPLQTKRSQRNPFARHPDYSRTCPEMAQFLDTIRITNGDGKLNV